MTEVCEEEKRGLQKLLREYDANSGMAGMVCGRPVELMPAHEQERILGGFCTPANLRVLAVSREKLALARNLDISQAEAVKIDNALPTLDRLIKAFTGYLDSSLSRAELRKEVRKILAKPLPQSIEGLSDSLSHLIKTLEFLATQPLNRKDSWDRMVDCVQMHDALSRTEQVCLGMHTLISYQNGHAAQSGSSVAETLVLARTSLEFLEGFFQGGVEPEPLQQHFTSLSKSLKKIWIDRD